MNYGTISKDTWQDPFFGDLTPEERYFILYLNTCPQGQMCGVWAFNRRLAAAETGYNDETVMRLVVRMQEASRILYDPETREILLVDWGVRNAGLFRASANKKENSTVTKIRREADKIRNAEFRHQVKMWLADGASTGGEPPNYGGGNIYPTVLEPIPKPETPPTPPAGNTGEGGGESMEYTGLTPALLQEGYEPADINCALRAMAGRSDIAYPAAYARSRLRNHLEEKNKKKEPDANTPTTSQVEAMAWYEALQDQVKEEIRKDWPPLAHQCPGGLQYADWCCLTLNLYSKRSNKND